MAKYTDAKRNSNRKWDANNIERISFTVPKGQKATVEAAAQAAGESVNQYTQKALLARMGLEEWPATQESSDE